MLITEIKSSEDFDNSVLVLKEAYGTVARDFGLTKENCATNAAFLEADWLQKLLDKGLLLHKLYIEDDKQIGFVGIEKSLQNDDVLFIEKLAVLPEYRHQGYGQKLMEFAFEKIKELGGKKISVALIDEHVVLKKWYASLGFHAVRTKVFEHLPFHVCFMEREIG